jgi:hypothetical protein
MRLCVCVVRVYVCVCMCAYLDTSSGLVLGWAQLELEGVVIAHPVCVLVCVC